MTFNSNAPNQSAYSFIDTRVTLCRTDHSAGQYEGQPPPPTGPQPGDGLGFASSLLSAHDEALVRARLQQQLQEEECQMSEQEESDGEDRAAAAVGADNKGQQQQQQQQSRVHRNADEVMQDAAGAAPAGDSSAAAPQQQQQQQQQAADMSAGAMRRRRQEFYEEMQVGGKACVVLGPSADDRLCGCCSCAWIVCCDRGAGCLCASPNVLVASGGVYKCWLALALSGYSQSDGWLMPKTARVRSKRKNHSRGVSAAH
jgi:hypothetical protein